MEQATAAVVIDGDASWFNNPQYRLSCSAPSTIYISVIPLGNGEDGDIDQAQMSVSILKSSRNHSSSLHVPIHMWDLSQFEVIATDRYEHGPTPVKGQETSIWAVPLDTKHFFHVVPNPLRRGRECENFF